MQKKIIALALASLATGAAFAQSNVTIYGRVDYGFLNRGDENGLVAKTKTKNEFASGNQAGSRIGFRGAEDLGNGLKAIFETEFGIGVDQNSTLGGTNATWTNRHSYVGLTGGFGTAVGGRLDGVRYGIFNKYDAFGGGTVGNFTQMTAQVDRASNAVAYITPNFSGFTGTFAYATHIGNSNPLALANAEGGNAASARNGNDGDARLYTAMGNYANGPIDVTLDWERVDFKSGGAIGSTAAALDKVTVYLAGASYDFGVVKVSALYDVLKADKRAGGNASDVKSWFVSAKAPIGKFNLKATYGQTKDKVVSGDNKAAKWGIGADYNLSKRTNFYADYGRINNGDNTAYEISPAANTYGAGYGIRGFDLGIAHNF